MDYNNIRISRADVIKALDLLEQYMDPNIILVLMYVLQELEKLTYKSK